MNSKSSHADGITMSGGGAYSLATRGAKDVIDAATPLVIEAIESMPLDGADRAFTLSDMGCADGGTSLDMVRAAVTAVRRRASALAVQVVYADQPRNDFNALVRIVHGLTDFRSYLDDFDAVYPLFSAGSFYRRIVPAGSLDLGFSATAMHWLSAKPCDISGHVHAVGAHGEEHAAFARHARGDWETILLHRAAELRPGGRLVLINFCRDEQGRYLGNTGGISMFDSFNEIWQSFVRDGIVTAQEYAAMTLPQYYNTVEEFSAPLRDPDSAVFRAGLRLEHIETRIVPCPFAAAFARHGDPGRFAREYIPTIRTWNESIFYGGLSAQRPASERRELIERYYATYRDRVEQAPDGHAMDYVHAYLVISKIQ